MSIPPQHFTRIFLSSTQCSRGVPATGGRGWIRTNKRCAFLTDLKSARLTVSPLFHYRVDNLCALIVVREILARHADYDLTLSYAGFCCRDRTPYICISPKVFSCSTKAYSTLGYSSTPNLASAKQVVILFAVLPTTGIFVVCQSLTGTLVLYQRCEGILGLRWLFISLHLPQLLNPIRL